MEYENYRVVPPGGRKLRCRCLQVVHLHSGTVKDDVLAIVEVDSSIPVVGSAGLFKFFLQPGGNALLIRRVSRLYWAFVEPRAASNLCDRSSPVDGRSLTP